jgi:hypothetical protein
MEATISSPGAEPKAELTHPAIRVGKVDLQLLPNPEVDQSCQLGRPDQLFAGVGDREVRVRSV